MSLASGKSSKLFPIFFLIFSPSVFAIEQLEVIDSYGNWTLNRLGYLPILFTGQNDTESYTVRYILPPNASQGPGDWYLVNLNFLIEFSKNSTNGYAYVSALTNNRSSALIKFTVKKNNDSLLINWSERNLLGVSRYSTTSSVINVSFTNYLQYQGVIPGVNTLTFKLEQHGDIKVKRLEISPTTGIELTPLSPPELKLDVKLPRDSISNGDSFIINFTLKNFGDQPPEDVLVRAVYPKEALELVGDASYYAPHLENKLEGQFEFKALKKGDHQIVIMTETISGIKRPSARILVPVGDKKGFSPLLLPIAVSVLALLTYFFRKNRRV